MVATTAQSRVYRHPGLAPVSWTGESLGSGLSDLTAFVATDSAGNTATSTRTVLIEEAPSIVPDTSATTDQSSASASTTTATSSFQ